MGLSLLPGALLVIDELGAGFRRHRGPLYKVALGEADDHPPKARGPVPERRLRQPSCTRRGSTKSCLFDDGWLLPMLDVKSGLDWRWLNPEPSTRPRPISRLDAGLAVSGVARTAGPTWFTAFDDARDQIQKPEVQSILPCPNLWIWGARGSSAS